MMIEIDINALNDPLGNFPFRPNTLSALLKIQQFGYDLKIIGGSLTELQLQLLDQEHIKSIGTGKAALLITTDSEVLAIHKDSKLVFTSPSWADITDYLTTRARKASLSRTTRETDIQIELNLDGTGTSDIDTGLKFFDHMLDQIARHGLIDLKIHCKGDLEVDEHHTIEDTAIALGETILKALGDKKGLERYGFVLPMDEAQAIVALDLSNRPYLVFDVPLTREYIGDFPTDMLEHFFYSLAMNLKATLHISCTGKNDHHKIEACFKGFARSLKTAIEQNGRIKHLIPSSKGTL